MDYMEMLTERIEQLTNNLKYKDDRYDEIEKEIKDLEHEKICLEDEIDDLRQRIELIKALATKNELARTITNAESSFVSDFIVASYFADMRENGSPKFSNVMITESALFATNSQQPPAQGRGHDGATH